MPQVKTPLLRRLVKEALKEAELTAGPENTKFSINVDLGNKQSETKLGVRIQLKPSDVTFLETGKKDQLEAAIMTKINNSLEQFNIQISKDTDVPDPEIMGFFIPLSQLRNLIISSLKGPGEITPTEEPPTSTPPQDKQTPPKQTPPSPEDEEELAEQEDPLDRAERLAKEPLPDYGDKWKTGLSLKQSGYADEKIGPLFSTEELYEKVALARELLMVIYQDINNSEYSFKEYLLNNEDQYTRVGAVMSMLEDELEDRLELEEPVGPDQGIEERFKNVIKKLVKEQTKQPLNEVQMKVRELNEISKIVNKDDFYEFINKGNNILRTLEENGNTNGKKYLEYLVKNNIM